MRILIIEDHDDVRQALRFFLRVGGHDVLDFDSAEAAADLNVYGLAPDVAILAVQLPGRAGDAFARDLVWRYPRVKVIFATDGLDLERLKAAAPGCIVLRKPIDLDVLEPMLRCLRAAQPPCEGARLPATVP